MLIRLIIYIITGLSIISLTLSIGYTYSNLTLATRFLRLQSQVLEMPSPKTPYHGISLRFKYFLQGNINPIGRYFGMAVEAGRTGLELIDVGHIQDKELILSSRFRREYILTDFVKTDHDLFVEQFNSFFLKVFIGKNTALTKQLYLSTEVSFNITGGSLYLGTFNRSALEEINESYTLYDDIGSSLRNYRAISNSLFAYKRLMLNLGLHYAF